MPTTAPPLRWFPACHSPICTSSRILLDPEQRPSDYRLRSRPRSRRSGPAELRSLAEQKAGAYAASRVSGTADVVVVGRADEREGITGDYLSVRLADRALPRGARFAARLSMNEENRLVAQSAE